MSPHGYSATTSVNGSLEVAHYNDYGLPSTKNINYHVSGDNQIPQDHRIVDDIPIIEQTNYRLKPAAEVSRYPSFSVPLGAESWLVSSPGRGGTVETRFIQDSVVQRQIAGIRSVYSIEDTRITRIVITEPIP